MITLENLNESLVTYSCVKKVSINLEFPACKYNLILIMQESDNEFSNEFKLVFYDVSNLELKNFGGGLTQFMHLRIIKDENGLSRIKYHLQELEEDKIYFSFFKYEVL